VWQVVLAKPLQSQPLGPWRSELELVLFIEKAAKSQDRKPPVTIHPGLQTILRSQEKAAQHLQKEYST
jgi:hypothetical protein